MHRAAAGIAVAEASKHVSNSLEEQAGSVRCGGYRPGKRSGTGNGRSEENLCPLAGACLG
jgi:hypothetical protein